MSEQDRKPQDWIMIALEGFFDREGRDMPPEMKGALTAQMALACAGIQGKVDIAPFESLLGVSDDEDGADPTTADLLKPRGNDGVVSPEICFDALLLVGDPDITEEMTEGWTQDERDHAYDWAMRVHLRASDNDDVFVPERPDHIPLLVRRTYAEK